MSQPIEIHDVPDATYRTLEARARRVGQTVAEYVRDALIQSAATPTRTLDEIDARIRARGPSNIKLSTTLDALRESRD